MIQIIEIRDIILVDFDTDEFERKVEEFVKSYSNDHFQLRENTSSFVYKARRLLAPTIDDDKMVFDEVSFAITFEIGNKVVTLPINISKDIYDMDTIESISNLIVDRIEAYKNGVLALYHEVLEAYADRETINYDPILKPKGN